MLTYNDQLAIALNLSYPDVISFTKINNDQFFWSQKLQRDFPNYIINNNINFKNNYIVAWHNSFSEFKKSYGLLELRNITIDDIRNEIFSTGEITFYKNKLTFPYLITDYGSLNLVCDLFVADINLWGSSFVKTKYVMLPINMDNNSTIDNEVEFGNAIGINDLESLKLEDYKYATNLDNKYEYGFNDSKENIERWEMLGFIHKL